MLKIHTTSAEEKDFAGWVNDFINIANEKRYIIQDIEFKFTVSRDKSDNAHVHCIAFIKYDDGKNK